MRTSDWIRGTGLTLSLCAVMGCGDSEGGGTSSGGGGGGGAPATTGTASTTTGPTSTSTSTSSSQGTGGSGEGGAGGAGGSGSGGAGSFVCGDGVVVAGERCHVAGGIHEAYAESNVVVADIDEDGDGDLLTASQVIRNDGGRFTVIGTDNYSGARIAVGDVDGDGHLDMVAPNGKGLEIHHGNGDGTFRAPQVLPMPNDGGQHAAIGDLDGDGLNDIAVVTLDAVVAFYIADGVGGFTMEEHALGNDWLIQVEIADLDGDDRNEVIVLEEYDVVDVWDGSGWTPYSIVDESRQFALADLDVDGALDLVVASTTGEAVDVLLGDGDAGFGPSSPIALPWGTRSLAVADFDGDGSFDIVAGSIAMASDDPPIHQIAVLYGDHGTFAPVSLQDFPCDPRNFGAGDINADGVPDVAGVCNNEQGSPTAASSGGAGGGAPDGAPAIGLWTSNP